MSEGDGPPRGNLFADLRFPDTGESVETLCRASAGAAGPQGGVRIERILSSGEVRSRVYDQDHDEWVLLLRGAARLEVEGAELSLLPGDHLLLRAHVRHRVLGCAPGTIWLAVHVEG